MMRSASASIFSSSSLLRDLRWSGPRAAGARTDSRGDVCRFGAGVGGLLLGLTTTKGSADAGDGSVEGKGTGEGAREAFVGASTRSRATTSSAEPREPALAPVPVLSRDLPVTASDLRPASDSLEPVISSSSLAKPSASSDLLSRSLARLAALRGVEGCGRAVRRDEVVRCVGGRPGGRGRGVSRGGGAGCCIASLHPRSSAGGTGVSARARPAQRRVEASESRRECRRRRQRRARRGSSHDFTCTLFCSSKKDRQIQRMPGQRQVAGKATRRDATRNARRSIASSSSCSREKPQSARRAPQTVLLRLASQLVYRRGAQVYRAKVSIPVHMHPSLTAPGRTPA